MTKRRLVAIEAISLLVFAISFYADAKSGLTSDFFSYVWLIAVIVALVCIVALLSNKETPGRQYPDERKTEEMER